MCGRSRSDITSPHGVVKFLIHIQLTCVCVADIWRAAQVRHLSARVSLIPWPPPLPHPLPQKTTNQPQPLTRLRPARTVRTHKRTLIVRIICVKATLTDLVLSPLHPVVVLDSEVSVGPSAAAVVGAPLTDITMSTKAMSVVSVTSQCSYSSTIVHVPQPESGTHTHLNNLSDSSSQSQLYCHISICAGHTET